MFSNWSSYTPLTYFFEALALAAFVVEAWALIDAATRPSRAFVAAGKQTKALWLIITGVSAAVGLGYAAYVKNLSIIQILPVAAFVAAAVYLTDVKPKVREMSGRGGNTHSGPYGPW